MTAILARRIRVSAAVIALSSALSVVVFGAVQLPRWERKISALPVAKDRITAQNEVFRTLIQLAGGSVLLVGLYFSSRTLRVSQEGQITDRFSKAIDHIGSPTLAIRLGGIYALARIAADSSRDAPTVVEIFSAFLRDALKAPCTPIPSDVSSMLNLLGTAEWARATVKDLRGCHLDGLMTRRLDFSQALLEDAVFSGCRLPNMRFDGANLRGTDFQDAYLRDSSFRASDVVAANFQGGALHGADFREANIFGANFKSASLLGANFEGATGAIRQQFEVAYTDETTRLPEFATVERSNP